MEIIKEKHCDTLHTHIYKQCTDQTNRGNNLLFIGIITNLPCVKAITACSVTINTTPLKKPKQSHSVPLQYQEAQNHIR